MKSRARQRRTDIQPTQQALRRPPGQRLSNCWPAATGRTRAHKLPAYDFWHGKHPRRLFNNSPTAARPSAEGCGHVEAVPCQLVCAHGRSRRQGPWWGTLAGRTPLDAVQAAPTNNKAPRWRSEHPSEAAGTQHSPKTGVRPNQKLPPKGAALRRSTGPASCAPATARIAAKGCLGARLASPEHPLRASDAPAPFGTGVAAAVLARKPPRPAEPERAPRGPWSRPR